MNSTMQRVEADLAVSVTDLKKNPAAVFKAAEEQPVAVLNHNRVVGYIVSPEGYEGMLGRLDDLDLIAIVNERSDEKGVLVKLDEL